MKYSLGGRYCVGVSGWEEVVFSSFVVVLWYLVILNAKTKHHVSHQRQYQMRYATTSAICQMLMLSAKADPLCQC